MNVNAMKLMLMLIFSAIIGFGMLRSCNVMLHASNYSNANFKYYHCPW
jgi:hypothetical protein